MTSEYSDSTHVNEEQPANYSRLYGVSIIYYGIGFMSGIVSLWFWAIFKIIAIAQPLFPHTPKPAREHYIAKNDVLNILGRLPANPIIGISHARLAQVKTLSFSFGANDWSIFYELGVAKCLQERLHPSTLASCKFLGRSFGGLVAYVMAVNQDALLMKRQLLKVAASCREQWCGELCGFLGTALEPLIVQVPAPERLFLSATKFPSMSTARFSTFENKEVCLNEQVIGECIAGLHVYPSGFSDTHTIRK
jgi:hypothetical protein